jgi:hypothetical protein
MLLKDPEDDSMYEVEIMLGDTDETHIIRTIEYWDNEKRKWPKRQHYAVIVAESITKRFYNVIHLLSNAIPLIAVQVNIVEAGGNHILHFTKILDTYEEPEDDDAGPDEVHDEDYWQKKSPWTLETAKALLEVVKPVFNGATLNLKKNYIAISVHGNNYLWLHKRSGGKSLVGLWFTEENIPGAQKAFDSADVSYVKKKDRILITTDKNMVQSNAKAIQEATRYVKKSSEG